MRPYIISLDCYGSGAIGRISAVQKAWGIVSYGLGRLAADNV
jgi:hypothetical protein